MTYIEHLPEDAELFFQMNDYKNYTSNYYVGYVVRPNDTYLDENKLEYISFGPFNYEDNVYFPVQYSALIDDFCIVTSSDVSLANGLASYDYEAVSVPHRDKIKFQKQNSFVKLSTSDPNRWYMYDRTIHIVTKFGNTYHCENDLLAYLPEDDFHKIFTIIKEPILTVTKLDGTPYNGGYI